MVLNCEGLRGKCTCGKVHEILVENIYIEKGAIEKLPEVIAKKESENICIICDDNTYEAVGKNIEILLEKCSVIKLNSENLHANEKAVYEVIERVEKLSNKPDLFIAAGSGTIHDITRYVAYKGNIGFISVPTAASVDGYVSTVAAMTWKGCKKTLQAVSPIAVIADTEVFSRAPYRLTASGISDLLGKYIALADWKIANILTGEYLCEKVCNIEYEALEKVCNNIENIKIGKEEAYEELMYALLLSGLAMQMVGNSRPASGAEHHFSHLWEMELINGYIDAYHGEKVSVGLMLAIEKYKGVNELIKNNKIKFCNYNGTEFNLIREAVKSDEIYNELVKENTPDSLEYVSIDILKTRIEHISKVIDDIPDVENMQNIIRKAGCKEGLNDIGLDNSILDKSIKLSPYVRNRLTFMRVIKLLLM